MSERYSENGNRHMKAPAPPDELSASDFKLEAILTAVMLGFVAAVYIILSALGITPGLKEMCAKKEKEPSPPPAAEVSVVTRSDEVSAADAIKAEPHDMGAQTLFMCRTVSLVPEGEKCTSYTSSNEQAATVASDGTVTPVAVGQADITGTGPSGSTYTWHLDVRKVAYLTFSDFPNDTTNTILNVLRDKNVKATFFVCMRS